MWTWTRAWTHNELLTRGVQLRSSFFACRFMISTVYLQSELVINVDILEWYMRTIMSQEIVYEKWDECCWSLVPTNRRTSFTTKKSFDLGFQRFKWSNRRLFKSSEVHEIEVHKIRVHDTRVHDTRVYDKRVHDKRVYNKRVSRYDSRVHYMNLSE